MREQGAGVGPECCCDVVMRRKQIRENDVFYGMAKMGGKGTKNVRVVGCTCCGE